jgi:hypothetical protein
MVAPAPGLPLYPTATQSFELAQEIPVISTALAGAGWFVQLEPALSVPIT